MIIIFIFVIVVILWYIFKYIEEKKLENNPVILNLKQKLTPVFPELNKVKLLKGKESYTINKNKIYICTEDKKNNIYDMNMLTFVTLHELAHVLCDEIGHTQNFYKIFNNLLEKAYKYNLYDPFLPKIVNYCK